MSNFSAAFAAFSLTPPPPMQREPNTDSQKTTHLLFPPSKFYNSYFSLPPSPLCNVDVGSDTCQETVRDPKDNIESGGGGGVFGSLLVYK